MSRQKMLVPTPAWVTPEMIENRRRHAVAHKVGATRRAFPYLAAATAEPVPTEHPRPKLRVVLGTAAARALGIKSL